MLGWLAYPVTAAWLVGVTNAFNLIDGVDGLAPGIAALAGAACGAILIVRGHTAEAMLLAAFVGAMLGFLVYNFEPATIFLGDSGSLVAGFLLAATAIAGWQKGATALASAVPLLIFALPLADAASTLVRRALARPEQRPIAHRHRPPAGRAGSRAHPSSAARSWLVGPPDRAHPLRRDRGAVDPGAGHRAS